jgi:hypothetical protein
MSDTAECTMAKYFHGDGKSCHANIIWGERNLGDAYYRYSKHSMKGGKFPDSHPIAPGKGNSNANAEMGTSEGIEAMRAKGYWFSCFPEGDGVTMSFPEGATRDSVIADIESLLPLKIVGGA